MPIQKNICQCSINIGCEMVVIIEVVNVTAQLALDVRQNMKNDFINC